MLEIVEANTNRDLTTLAAVKAELGDAGVSDDQLQRFITQASDVIAGYCNRVFAIETVKETFRFSASAADIMLARYPVTEVVSIVEAETTLIADGYEINPATGIIHRVSSSGAIWRWSCGKTVVTYKAGFALPDDLPEGIERACITLVKGYAASGDRDPMVRSETSDGVGSTDYFSGAGTGLPPEVEGLISLHRVPNA
jgi:hypothetical protein